MIELVRFDLLDQSEWSDYHHMFGLYLRTVCSDEEYQEEMEDLNDDELNSQMIEQTLRAKNPYFIMRIVNGDDCLGFITYWYDEEQNYGVINNFFVVDGKRNAGVGTKVYQMVEKHLASLGAKHIKLIPVEKARSFYFSRGFSISEIKSDGSQVFSKEIS